MISSLSILIALTVFCFILALTQPAVNVISERLGNGSEGTGVEQLQQPFTQRVIRPLRGWLLGKVSFMLPKEKKDSWQKRLWQAGFYSAEPSDLIAAKLLAATVATGIVFFLTLFGTAGTNIVKVAQVLVPAGLTGYLLPELMLRRRIVQRKQNSDKELPDCLDLLTISVEAGLGLDSALAKVVEKGKGLLPKEFAYLLREMQMGQPRKTAWRNLADRVGTEDFGNFVSAVVQAEQLGVGVAHVLRSQSGQVRTKRRQKIEEKAMKAPVKMLLPLVMFIFPTMFVVLLGPALIQIVRVLGQ